MRREGVELPLGVSWDIQVPDERITLEFSSDANEGAQHPSGKAFLNLYLPEIQGAALPTHAAYGRERLEVLNPTI